MFSLKTLLFSLNLVFLCFFYVFEKKTNKLETTHIFPVFLVLLVFENKTQFSKTVNK